MKLFITLSLLLVTGLVVAGCMSSEQKAEVEDLAGQAAVLAQNIKDAEARMKAGTLDLEEGILLIAGWASESVQIYSKINELHKEGVGWFEMLGTGFLWFMMRGYVSKGPLLPVFNFVGSLFGAKKTAP